jgi:hypothetical protein
MNNLIRMQFRLALSRPEIYIAFYALFAVGAVSFLSYVSEYLGWKTDAIHTMAAHTTFLGHANYKPHTVFYFTVIPLLVPFAFSDSYFTERANGTDMLLFTRASRGRYIAAKGICVFCVCFVLAALPLLLNQLLNLAAFPLDSVRDYTNNPTYSIAMNLFAENIFFADLMRAHPYIYNALFIALGGLYAAVCGIAVYTLSFFIRKYRYAVTASLFAAINALTFILLVVSNAGLLSRTAIIAQYYMIAADDNEKYPFAVFLSALLVALLLCCLVLRREAKKARL